MANFNIEVYELVDPIKVFYVAADSFPIGIKAAHEKLHTIVPFNQNRDYFGISWGGETITYLAAAAALKPGELDATGLQTFVIKAGKYLAVMIHDYVQIKDVFTHLIQDPRIDPNGYCVEMYLDDRPTVRCLIKADDSKV